MVEEIVKNRKIAIMKDIEKSQTLPIMAMLHSLFEQNSREQENGSDFDDSDFDDSFDFIEKKFLNGNPEEEWLEETTIPKIRYERLEIKMDFIKNDFNYVLDNVKVVKSSFGKNV